MTAKNSKQKGKLESTERQPEPDHFELLIVIFSRWLFRSVKKLVEKLPTLVTVVHFLSVVAIRMWHIVRKQPVVFYLFLIAWLWVFMQGEHSLFQPLFPAGRGVDDIIGNRVVVHFGTYLIQTGLLLGALILAALNFQAIRKYTWRKAIGWVNLAILAVATVFAQATAVYSVNFSATMAGNVSNPPTLAQVIDMRAQCGDAIQMVDSYSYGAKTFYDLKQAGWHLAATYESSSGNLDTDGACNTYYAVRDKYPADHIIAQLFTYDNSGQPAPYLYKDIGNSNVADGIFVKD